MRINIDISYMTFSDRYALTFGIDEEGEYSVRYEGLSAAEAFGNAVDDIEKEIGYYQKHIAKRAAENGGLDQ